jgi:glycosyltransferase 2 family protein
MGNKFLNKRIVSIVGNVLVLVSVLFIVYKIVNYNINFAILITPKMLGLFILFALISSILVMVYAKIFSYILITTTEQYNKANKIVYIYCKSNLYKYLPGNVFHYVGRNQIALDHSITHQEVISASVAEMIMLVTAGTVVSITFAGNLLTKWIISGHTVNDKLFFFSLLIMVVLAFVLLFKYNRVVQMYLTELYNNLVQIKFTTTIMIIMLYILLFCAQGAMFFIMFNELGGTLKNSMIFPIIGVYTCSWLIGFVTPGAPAGLGIREVFIAALLTSMTDQALIITVVVIYRIISILGDVFGFGIVSAAYKLVRK